MYAATESEMAYESTAWGHGLFTRYFLEAINNASLYDEDGILTTNRIQDYIARETAKESKFKQNPVIENRSAGYYPFAFSADTSLTQDPSLEEVAVVDEVGRATVAPATLVDRLYFPAIPVPIRERVQAALKELLLQTLMRAVEEFQQADYIVTTGENLRVFPNEADEKVTRSIVERAKTRGLDAVNQLFYTEQRSNKGHGISSRGWLDTFIHQNQNAPSFESVIRWTDDNIAAYSLYLQSSDVQKVSGGIVVIVYQAVYGIGLASALFSREFTGYEEGQVTGVASSLKAFKVHEQLLANVEHGILEIIAAFKSQLGRWNKTRQQQIEAFDNNAQ